MAPASLERAGNLKPHERQRLSREELAATHGADPQDVAKIDAFAYEHGLDVVEANLAARTVILSGTVQALSEAFNVTLHMYEHPSGTYRGRTGGIEIPAGLEGIVQGVFGLDNRPQARPHMRPIHEQGGRWRSSQRGVSYLPTQVAKLYDFPTSANGQGQCIAIIELGGGYKVKDLNTYFQQLGIAPPQITAVSVGGAHNAPTGSPNGRTEKSCSTSKSPAPLRREPRSPSTLQRTPMRVFSRPSPRPFTTMSANLRHLH